MIAEYLEILGLITVGIIVFGWLLGLTRRTVEAPKETSATIEERIGCVGQYNGKDIPSHVRLDDGRLFEYSSLAIQDGKGNYFAKEKVHHIKVDENLLYKLVIE